MMLEEINRMKTFCIDTSRFSNIFDEGAPRQIEIWKTNAKAYEALMISSTNVLPEVRKWFTKQIRWGAIDRKDRRN